MYPISADAPSKNLYMIYQWNPRLIKNVIRLYESKIQHHIFLLSLWKHSCSSNDSFRFILDLLVGQLFKAIHLKQTVIRYFTSYQNLNHNLEAIVKNFIGFEQVTKQGNNKYTHITLYVGVTIKEFHLQ